MVGTPPLSVLRFFYPGELEFGSAGLLKCHVIAGDIQLINRCGEWRFNFDPVLVAEFISAANISNEHRTVIQKFPNRLIFSSRHSPFANDAGMSAGRYREHQDR